jgi:two-component system, NarL family, response regulator LiaR
MTPSRQYRPRVVVVDDHPLVLRELSRLLGIGCEVVASVDNGQQGIDAAVRLKPDVMVVDLMMPEMNGLEVCHRMKEMASETDVIIVTAFYDVEIEKVALQAGAAAFMAKEAAATCTLENTIHRLVEKKTIRQVAG